MNYFKFTRLLPRFDQNADMNTANASINTAKNAGNQAINSFDPTATAQNQQQNTGNLFNTQNSQTQNYINKYAGAVANNPTVTSLYNQGNTLFNVPALQRTATNLSNQVNNAIPEGYAGAKGFDIDATDINNGVAAKLGYLGPQSNAATANANTAAGLAGQFVQAGLTQNQQNLLPVQAEQANLLQQQAAQATGWNQASKSQFDGLIEKMKSGVELSSQEMQAAQQLAATEEAYNQNLATAQAAITTAEIGQKYQKLTPSETLFNTTNGVPFTPIGFKNLAAGMK